MAERKGKKRDTGYRDTDCGDKPRTTFFCKAVAVQAGNHRAKGDNH